jgi:hypothetical protein
VFNWLWRVGIWWCLGAILLCYAWTRIGNPSAPEAQEPSAAAAWPQKSLPRSGGAKKPFAPPGMGDRIPPPRDGSSIGRQAGEEPDAVTDEAVGELLQNSGAGFGGGGLPPPSELGGFASGIIGNVPPSSFCW